MIPKLAHFIWLGGEMPEPYRRNIEDFRVLHPAWRVIVHPDPEIARERPHVYTGLTSIDAKLLAACPFYATRCDLLRLWILHTYGGFYFDCDFAWLRPVDDLLHHEVVIGKHRYLDGKPRLDNAVLGVDYQWSWFTSEAIDRTRDVYEQYQCRRRPRPIPRVVCGPRIINAMYADGKLAKATLLEPAAFYPFARAGAASRAPWASDNRPPFRELPNTYAVHLMGLPAGSSKRSAPLRAEEVARRVLPLVNGSCIGAEVGVWTGQTSQTLFRLIPNLRLYMVDQWSKVAPDSSYGRSGDAALRKTAREFRHAKAVALSRTDEWSDRRVVIHSASVDAAAQVIDGALDFVFIDADHSYEGCLADLQAWGSKVRPGGLLCGHDWQHPRYPQWGVKRAVQEYVAARGWSSPIETSGDLTWFIIIPEHSHD